MPREVAQIKTNRVRQRRLASSTVCHSPCPCVRQDALVAVCGSEAAADQVEALWADIKTKNRLDLSDQGLSDEAVGRVLKGLHMCAAILHFLCGEIMYEGPPPPLAHRISKADETYVAERTKPFPISELDFSGACRALRTLQTPRHK